ncbi:MAG: N-acetylglucosamine-6-phosphate deacetylase [Ruminococcaceae bacterium]|nr:N-acetylglucosamine-6-phosphate deacetylase [Oscillospiraceae bacterium]
MITKISGGKVITDRKIEKKDVYIEDGKIIAVTSESMAFDNEIDTKGNYVSAGFIDIHTHGAIDYDFLDNDEESYIKIARAHAEHGAGTILPTITSAGKEETLNCLRVFEKIKNVSHDGANMPGLHLEGPYFSPLQAGAQDPNIIRNFDKAEYTEFLNVTDSIMRWTGAPELEGSEEFAKTLTAKGILPCIGHSDADGDCAKEAFKNGFTHATHLYSSMSIVHRKNAFRYTGIVETAYLIDDMTVEIIADGVHLPADLLKLVYKIKGPDKACLITDSMRGAGMPEGTESMLGSKTDGLRVIIEDGVAKLPDRTSFAGSVAFCDRLVRNMVNMADVPLEDAIYMITQTPAKIVGLDSKGSINPGMDADIIIFDKDINILKNIIGGRIVFSK